MLSAMTRRSWRRSGAAPARGATNTERQPSIERTMTRSASEVTKDQLIANFNAVVAETEQLLKSVANAGGEKAGVLRASVEQNLAIAKDRLRDLQQAATEKTQAAAHAADEYVHEHPWQAIGIAAGLSGVIGMVVGLLLNRR